MAPSADYFPPAEPLFANSLKSFGITRNAFLPETAPVTSLSHSYYQPWESIVKRLPSLIDEYEIQAAVQSLSVLSCSFLSSEAEWRRAYVLLGFMAHAYIWGGEEPEEILPPQITIPFLQVARHFDLPPVLTYAGAALWNFTATSTDFTNLDTLETLVTFTGTNSESWFYLVSVAMEARASGIINTMMAAITATNKPRTSKTYAIVTAALRDLTSCIDSIGELLERMYEGCDPTIFYHRIRPFLAGSQNMEAAGLPRGVFYDEGNGKGEWRHYRGGSNGQSSLIQFFDVVLGVDHGTGGSPGKKSYHDEVKEYMPGPHRRFLEHISRMGSLQNFIVGSKSTTGYLSEDTERMTTAYEAATEALARFRGKHIQIVARYIILPSKQPVVGDKGRKRVNLASCSSGLSAAMLKGGTGQLVGSGGTDMVPFLKKSREETLDAGRLVR